VSFTTANTTGPPFFIAVIVLISLAPGFVEEGAPSWAFWIAGGLGVLFFIFCYAPLSMDDSVGGGSFCFGILILGPLAALAWYLWEPPPLAKALIPWAVLLAGPVVVFSIVLVRHAQGRAREVAARRSLIRIAESGARDELLPFLLDGNGTIRDAALAQLSAFPADPAGDAALLRAFFGAEKPSDRTADQLTARALERGTLSREDLLALYPLARSEGATDALARSLTGLSWDDPAALVEAARQRMDRHPREIDRVVQLLLETDRPAALELIREAIEHSCLRHPTLVALGEEELTGLLEELVARLSAGDALYESPFVTALFQLPAPFALPWLTRILEASTRRNLDLSFSSALREFPSAFAAAGDAPQAAASLLAAVQHRLANPESYPGDSAHLWEPVAQALRTALGQGAAPPQPAPGIDGLHPGDEVDC
jgi:hypothetical protein